jgi:hypothetical protein
MTKEISIISSFNKNYCSQDVLNMVLGTFISKHMISILKSPNSLSTSQIIKMIAILSLDEIRISFMGIIKRCFGIIGENYLNILWYIDKYILKNVFVKSFRYILNFILKWSIKPLLGLNNDKIYKINIKFTPTIHFMKRFLYYITPTDYIILPNHHIKMIEKNIITFKQTWLNVNTQYENINISILSNLNLTFLKTNNHIELLDFNVKNNHKLELELTSTICNETELYKKFDDFIFYIDNYDL